MSLRAAPDDFLSGTSGHVLGVRRESAALVADAFADTVALLSLRGARLRRAAQTLPPRRVLTLAIEREGTPNLLAGARREIERSHHDVSFVVGPAGDRGKFENLDRLLDGRPADGYDWLVVLDDDVSLPHGFLDAFLFLAERFELRLAQPAHRARSHAAWQVTRRRPFSVLRETQLVEIGPVTALHSTTFETLLPFPPLRSGWGLDLHWSALARERGWRLGIVDATPVRHGVRLIGAAYDREAAIAEAREFLSTRPYTRAAQAQQTLVTHRSW